jgi:hypothetical protein
VKALALGRDGLTPARLVGRIAAHDVRGAGGKIIVRKGQLLDAATAALALEAPWSAPLHVLELEPGDIHEEPAGSRLAQAAAGPGVQVKGYGGGQWTLAAARRGLVRVRHRALRDVNAESGIAVFTLWDLQPVDAGEVVAKVEPVDDLFLDLVRAVTQRFPLWHLLHDLKALRQCVVRGKSVGLSQPWVVDAATGVGLEESRGEVHGLESANDEV